jgi:hypothetical protein
MLGLREQLKTARLLSREVEGYGPAKPGNQNVFGRPSGALLGANSGGVTTQR